MISFRGRLAIVCLVLLALIAIGAGLHFGTAAVAGPHASSALSGSAHASVGGVPRTPWLVGLSGPADRLNQRDIVPVALVAVTIGSLFGAVVSLPVRDEAPLPPATPPVLRLLAPRAPPRA